MVVAGRLLEAVTGASYHDLLKREVYGTSDQALPNAMIQEGVRAYYKGGWYEDVVTDLPKVEDGFVSAPD
jgi:hypothetical protein